MRSRLLILALAAAALAVSGCSTSAPAATTSPPPSAPSPNPYGAAAIAPLGAAAPVVTVVGGGSGDVGLTMAELEGLGTTTVTVSEPFVKKQQSFTGVRLADILDKAGIAKTDTIDTIALNDYEYAASVSDLQASHALIPTGRDGEPIPYDQGGPVRLIFPDGSALAGNLDAWNWSLTRIEVTTGS